VAVRFSGECPGQRESTAVSLIRPDDLPGHPASRIDPTCPQPLLDSVSSWRLYPVTPDLPRSRRQAALVANTISEAARLDSA
jgi:hypothetical protein